MTGTASKHKHYLSTMEDIVQTTIDYLMANYPLTRPNLNYFSKVTKPTWVWTPMHPEILGCVTWAHHGLLMYLNSTYSYTEEALVETVAHEYRHMMQDERQYRWYTNRVKTGYWDHPLEKDARAFAAQILEELGY